MDKAPGIPSLEDKIRTLIREEPGEHMRELLREAEAVELADVFFGFSLAEQQMLLGLMPPEQAAQVITELDAPTLELLVVNLPPHSLAAYVALMEPDDGADVVGLLPPGASKRVLEMLSREERDGIARLMAYEPESAGGIMDPDVVRVKTRQTVAEAVTSIKAYVEQVGLDDFFSVFVVDDRSRLVGVVPNWKMLLAGGDARIGDIMEEDPVSVEAHLDQEEVTRLVRDRDLVTVPVVNAQGQLIGRITVDDIVDVMEEEHHEDLGRLTGTGDEAVRAVSIVQTLRDRTPWLFIAMAGQLLAAGIMRIREDILITIPQLALFIPAVMAMGGNTGVQSASLVIRGLATGEVRLSHFWRRLAREIAVAVCIGIVFAFILVWGGYLLTGNFRLGLAVGLSTLTTITISSTAGLVIPMVLRRAGLDPALATGPFLTTMNDVLGIMVYLLTAYLLLF
jgi:magnesium transporter